MMAFPSERAAAAEAEAGISLGAASIAFGSGFTSPGFIAVRKATKMLDKEWNRLLERRQVALADVYRDPAHFDLYCAAEAMIDWDERLLTWRDQHVRTVIRLIGRGARGTQ